MHFGTIHIAKKIYNQAIAKQNYRLGIEHMEQALSRQQGRSWWSGILFNNPKPLKEWKSDLELKRAVQCCERTRELVCSHSDDGPEKFLPAVPPNRKVYEEADRLLSEAAQLNLTDDWRILLEVVRENLHVIRQLEQGQRHIDDCSLHSAQMCLSEIQLISDDAKALLDRLQKDLGNCQRLVKKINHRISGNLFAEARDLLQQLLDCNQEARDLDSLQTMVDNGEQLLEITTYVQECIRTDQMASLDQARQSLIKARLIEPAPKHIGDDLTSLHKDLTARYLSKAHQFQNEKDIVGALEAFKKVVDLSPEHPSANAALSELRKIEQKIASAYEKGVESRHKKKMDRALDFFKKAFQQGFKYKDLEDQITECKQELEKCEHLLASAKLLIGPDQQKCEQAIEMVENAKHIFPDHDDIEPLLKKARLHHQIARLMIEAKASLETSPGNPQAAMLKIRELLTLEPEHAEALEMEAELQEKIAQEPTDPTTGAEPSIHKEARPVFVDKTLPPEIETETQTCPHCADGVIGADGMCDSPRCNISAAHILSDDIPQGTLIDQHFEVIEKLGEGGMGKVYLVEYFPGGDGRANGKKEKPDTVALKVINPAFLGGERARELFEKEIEINKSMTHPNIVNMHWYGEWEGTIYYHMEYIRGRSLREEIDERKKKFAIHQSREPLFSIEELNAIIDPVLEALDYAHGKTIHRDIKPENIMISGEYPNFSVKVLDFGIANPLTASEFSRTVSFAGTAYYMAPEQVHCTGDATVKWDLYSLAMVIYEMLTGMLAIGRFPALRNLSLGVPLHISNAVEKALAFEPINRFSEAKDMQSALFGRSAGLTFIDITEPDVEISAGRVEYPGGLKFEVGAFKIDREPVTYAQFSLFLEMVPNTAGAAKYSSFIFEAIWTSPGLLWLEENAGYRLSGPFDIGWNRPVDKISWYEAVAYCNWRTIFTYNRDLFDEKDYQKIVSELESLLCYDYEGELRSGTEGVRMPTEFELMLAYRHLNTDYYHGTTEQEVFEHCTNTYLEISNLRRYCYQPDPMPFFTKQYQTVINAMLQRQPMNPAAFRGRKCKFRCVQKSY